MGRLRRASGRVAPSTGLRTTGAQCRRGRGKGAMRRTLPGRNFCVNVRCRGRSATENDLQGTALRQQNDRPRRVHVRQRCLGAERAVAMERRVQRNERVGLGVRDRQRRRRLGQQGAAVLPAPERRYQEQCAGDEREVRGFRRLRVHLGADEDAGRPHVHALEDRSADETAVVHGRVASVLDAGRQSAAERSAPPRWWSRASIRRGRSRCKPRTSVPRTACRSKRARKAAPTATESTPATGWPTTPSPPAATTGWNTASPAPAAARCPLTSTPPACLWVRCRYHLPSADRPGPPCRNHHRSRRHPQR